MDQQNSDCQQLEIELNNVQNDDKMKNMINEIEQQNSTIEQLKNQIINQNKKFEQEIENIKF